MQVPRGELSRSLCRTRGRRREGGFVSVQMSPHHAGLRRPTQRCTSPALKHELKKQTFPAWHVTPAAATGASGAPALTPAPGLFLFHGPLGRRSRAPRPRPLARRRPARVGTRTGQGAMCPTCPMSPPLTSRRPHRRLAAAGARDAGSPGRSAVSGSGRGPAETPAGVPRPARIPSTRVCGPRTRDPAALASRWPVHSRGR